MSRTSFLDLPYDIRYMIYEELCLHDDLCVTGDLGYSWAENLFCITTCDHSIDVSDMWEYPLRNTPSYRDLSKLGYSIHRFGRRRKGEFSAKHSGLDDSRPGRYLCALANLHGLVKSCKQILEEVMEVYHQTILLECHTPCMFRTLSVWARDYGISQSIVSLSLRLDVGKTGESERWKKMFECMQPGALLIIFPHLDKLFLEFADPVTSYIDLQGEDSMDRALKFHQNVREYMACKITGHAHLNVYFHRSLSGHLADWIRRGITEKWDTDSSLEDILKGDPALHRYVESPGPRWI